MNNLAALELWTSHLYLSDTFAYSRYCIIKTAVPTRIPKRQKSSIITDIVIEQTKVREAGRSNTLGEVSYSISRRESCRPFIHTPFFVALPN